MPEDSDSIPVDWSIHIKAALVFLALIVFFELGLYAKSALSVFILTIGVLWLGWGIWIIRQSYMSKRWPVAEGVVIENSTGVVESPMERRAIYYFPVISYRYPVDGVEYVSNRIVLFPSDLRIAGGDADSYKNERKPYSLPARRSTHHGNTLAKLAALYSLYRDWVLSRGNRYFPSLC